MGNLAAGIGRLLTHPAFLNIDAREAEGVLEVSVGFVNRRKQLIVFLESKLSVIQVQELVVSSLITDMLDVYTCSDMKKKSKKRRKNKSI